MRYRDLGHKLMTLDQGSKYWELMPYQQGWVWDMPYLGSS